MTLAPGPCLSPFLETFPTLFFLTLPSSPFHSLLMGWGAWAWEDRREGPSGLLSRTRPRGAHRGECGFSWKSAASSTDWGPVAPGRTGGLTSHGPASPVTPRPTFFKAMTMSLWPEPTADTGLGSLKCLYPRTSKIYSFHGSSRPHQAVVSTSGYDLPSGSHPPVPHAPLCPGNSHILCTKHFHTTSISFLSQPREAGLL